MVREGRGDMWLHRLDHNTRFALTPRTDGYITSFGSVYTAVRRRRASPPPTLYTHKSRTSTTTTYTDSERGRGERWRGIRAKNTEHLVVRSSSVKISSDGDWSAKTNKKGRGWGWGGLSIQTVTLPCAADLEPYRTICGNRGTVKTASAQLPAAPIAFRATCNEDR